MTCDCITCHVMFSTSFLISSVQVSPSTTILELKNRIHDAKKGPYAGRQMLRLEAKGPGLKDEDPLSSTGFKSGGKLYMKDLGPQIAWTTVFLAEYAGPLVVYLWIYTRPWLFYGDTANKPTAQVVQ